MRKRLWLLGLFGVTLGVLSQFAAAEERLTIVTPGIVPISYEADGKITGIGTELVIEAFARLGQPIDIQIFPGARALKMLEDGEADALFALAKTPEREGFAAYPTEPIVDQSVVLFVRKDSTIVFNGDVKTLSPYSIGVIQGGRFSADFEAAMKNNLFPRLEPVNEYRQNILKLVDQRIDIVIGADLSVIFAAKEVGHQDAIKELQPALTASSPAYLAFSKKGKAIGLVTAFDETLKAMRADGTYDRIVDSFLK